MNPLTDPETAEIQARVDAYGKYSDGAGKWGAFFSHAPTDIRRLLADRKADKAIIDKLPKTADGVPVVPGMKVWMPDDGAGPDENFVSCDYVDNVRSTGQVYLRWSCGGSNGPPMNGWPLSTSCYFAREAAEAAAQEGKA